MYTAQTKHTLENLGITRKYKGYYYLSDAVEIVNINETALLNVGKQIYSPISIKYNCNSRTIERNIRTVILNAWKDNKYQIENIMGVKLTSPPPSSVILKIWMQRHPKRKLQQPSKR